MNNNSSQSPTHDFLIAEYQALQDRAAGLEQTKSSQINFFLIIVAAFIAGLAGLIEKFSSSIGFWYGVAASFSILFLLGLATLYNAVDYSITIVLLHRRAGRIRRWFAKLDRNIMPYLPFEASDDKPQLKLKGFYQGYRGSEPVLLIINATAFAGCIVTFLFDLFTIPLPWLTLIVIILVVLSLALQLMVINFILGIAEADQRQVRFPLKRRK